MKRLGMIVCAIRGHSWTDFSIDYRPEYTQRYERCERCGTWTMREVREPAPWLRLDFVSSDSTLYKP